jgi:hypothetical protein
LNPQETAVVVDKVVVAVVVVETLVVVVAAVVEVEATPVVAVEKEDKSGSNSQLDRGRFEWYFVLNNSFLRLQCLSPLSLTSCNR